MTWCLRQHREITILPWLYSPLVIISNYSNQQTHIKRLKPYVTYNIMFQHRRVIFSVSKIQRLSSSNTMFLVLGRLFTIVRVLWIPWKYHFGAGTCRNVIVMHGFCHCICICWLPLSFVRRMSAVYNVTFITIFVYAAATFAAGAAASNVRRIRRHQVRVCLCCLIRSLCAGMWHGVCWWIFTYVLEVLHALIVKLEAVWSDRC
jgi:hypothetical protein